MNAWAHATARKMVAEGIAEEERRTGKAERRQNPRGRGRRATDRAFLSRDEWLALVVADARVCPECGRMVAGTDGHACGELAGCADVEATAGGDR